MKRDMDFIRELLLRIEAGESSFKPDLSSDPSRSSLEEEWSDWDKAEEKIYEHLRLLEEKNLIEAEHFSDGEVRVGRLTWDGHDFIDAIRDPVIWSRTKNGALAAGGWTFDLIKDLAKGLIKKQIQDILGISI